MKYRLSAATNLLHDDDYEDGETSASYRLWTGSGEPAAFFFLTSSDADNSDAAAGDSGSARAALAGDTPPVVSIGDHSLIVGEFGQVATWMSYSDADNDAATWFQFWDGNSGATTGRFWTTSGGYQAAGVAISVAAADVNTVWAGGSTAASSETMYVRAYDGYDWSAWDSFTLTTVANTPPVATIADHSVAAYSWAQVANWLSYSDANGHAATEYQFWDSGTAATSGRFWTASGGYANANTTISIMASDISSLWVGGGTSGSETLWVRAYDGIGWGAWDTFTLTTVPNTTPVATINDQNVVVGRYAQVAGLVSYSDGENDAAVQYQFWDSGSASTSGRFWTANGGFESANTTISIDASDLGSLWVGGGTAIGSETLWIRANDGHNWGAWDTFTLSTVANSAPVATINDHSVAAYGFAQVANWMSYSDANGDAATQYQFWDGSSATTSSRFWTVSGGYQASGAAITVNPADLNNIWVGGGTAGGTETMYVRAYDGHDWGNWDSFVLTTVANAPPVATISDHSIAINQFAQVASWLSYSDAEGNPATTFQFWDGSAATSSARFWTADGGFQASGTAITVNPDDLNDIWVGGATAAVTETMYVRAFDGHDWGAWDSFALTSHV